MTNEVRSLLVRDWIDRLFQQSVSDAHIGADGCVAARIDGRLLWDAALGCDGLSTNELLLEFLSLEDRRHLDGCGDHTVMWRGQGCAGVRVHAWKERRGVRLSLRFLRAQVPDIDGLNLPPVVARLLEAQSGLFLFVGPTGSGKSTSLAAAVKFLSERCSQHVIVIEDPSEYVHESHHSLVVQREIGRDVPSIPEAILGALRCDPDSIAIGEMRDAPSISQALAAADTGHLVLSTMHTGSTTQGIERMIDAFDGATRADVRSRIADCLIGICAQRLIATENRPRELHSEVLVATDAVRALIRDGKLHQLRNAIATGRDHGMQPLQPYTRHRFVHVPT